MIFIDEAARRPSCSSSAVQRSMALLAKGYQSTRNTTWLTHRACACGTAKGLSKQSLGNMLTQVTKVSLPLPKARSR